MILIYRLATNLGSLDAITNFSGRTHYEFLYWGLLKAEESLRAQPERRKVLLILHDGDPVYEGVDGNDLALSQAHVRKLERQGLTVIGVYLGDDADLVVKLKRLFPHLIISSNNDLPYKLSNLLRSIV